MASSARSCAALLLLLALAGVAYGQGEVTPYVLRSHVVCRSATDLPVAQWSLKHHSAASEGRVPFRPLSCVQISNASTSGCPVAAAPAPVLDVCAHPCPPGVLTPGC
jgi:hypothetical protein